MPTHDLSNILSRDHLKFGIARQKIEPTQTIIKRRRLRWSHKRIQKEALRWTSEGKRKQGRPKAIWRRTIEKDIKAMGFT